MRTRRSTNEEVAEVARRRLAELSAELASIRPGPEEQLGSELASIRPGPEEQLGSELASIRPGPEEQLGSELASIRPGPEEQLGSELASIRPAPDELPASGPRPGSSQPPRLEHAPGAGRGAVPGRHAHRSVGAAAGLAGWCEDRLPPTLQGRVRMSAAHLGVVAVLVLAGLGLTAWWVSRADGGETLVSPLAVGASTTPGPGGAPSIDAGAAGTSESGSGSGSATGGPSPAATSVGTAAPAGGAAAAGSGGSPTGTIVVDVAGKVRRPGIATLPLGSRVVDALESAGGPRRGVRLGSLNLARVLADGEQILVGVPAPAGVAAGAAAAPTSAGGTAMVNINTATQAELEELPDVGPVTAQSILDFRAENGTFTAVEELLEVSGIGDATLAKMAPYVTL